MHDFRLAIRSLRSTPIVSTVAVLSLALGIGANTAIFSLVNSVLVRTLPVTDPRQLATVASDSAIRMGFTAGLGWSYAMWDRLRTHAAAAHTFDEAAAWSVQRFSLSEAGETQPVNALVTSGSFFRTLGVAALLGRTFTAADDVRGGGPDGPVAVISHGLWRRQFGGAADIIGRRIAIEGAPFTIVGVTPPEFLGIEVGRPTDISIPLGTEPSIRGRRASIEAPESLVLIVMVRLRPGQTIDAANAALRAMQPQILGSARMPDFVKEPFTLVRAARGTSGTEPGAPGLRQRFARPLLTIAIVVALVLLIACANIANLLLARAAARAHELSVRRALGAPGWRLARQLLVESLVLASCGGVVGVVFAAWSSRLLVRQLSTTDAHVTLDLTLDWRVLAFTAGVTCTTALLFGIAPAIRSMRAAPVDALKARGRGTPGGTGSMSNSLVVAQVALSLVLLVGTALFIRTFERLTTAPLGFDADRALGVNVNTSRAAIDAAQRIPFYHRLIDAVAAVQGVAHAAGSVWTPVNGGGARLGVDVPGAPPLPEAERRRVLTNFVTPGWFAVYGASFRAGRDFDQQDSATGLPVAVLGEAVAGRLFPGKDAVGRFIRTGGPNTPLRTIVGVVTDQVVLGGYNPLGTSRTARDGPTPMVYIPLAQSAGLEPPGASGIRITVRSAAGRPALLAPGIAAALTAVDSGIAFSFRPVADDVQAALAQERMLAILSGFFGTLALLLAALGLYGVAAYAVTRGRAEMAIRLALGAPPGTVVRLIVSRVTRLVAAGVIVGVGVSAWASKFVATLLFGVTPRDPVTLTAAALILTAIGALAAGIPALRAAWIDPADVLRDP